MLPLNKKPHECGALIIKDNIKSGDYDYERGRLIILFFSIFNLDDCIGHRRTVMKIID